MLHEMSCERLMERHFPTAYFVEFFPHLLYLFLSNAILMTVDCG